MSGSITGDQASLRALQQRCHNFWDDITIGYVPQNAPVYSRSAGDIPHDAHAQCILTFGKSLRSSCLAL